ncbi:hypothetical protein CAXC1_30010 [Candidatus Xenohaliotis californiensis]|uniref:Uncharacterized protein n=1 Tax=Candidatus Xenohaliotis californiensis TaxID=84677 RepID=A0ABM9N8X7_9RICK|nr:hypothetical protein CAXC1_30010 [Candidatus Xenohaliotis californiensis]
MLYAISIRTNDVHKNFILFLNNTV